MNERALLNSLVSQPRLQRLWSRRWRSIAWLGGGALVTVWIYFGMPMICH